MTDYAELAASVPLLAQARALCVGDVMLDRFVYGHVDRISPEAPIPVLRIERETAMLGGAGNVVRNLVGLKAHAEFISVVGNDLAGREVTTLVGQLEGIEPHLLVQTKRPTTIKSRFVAGSQQLLRADAETVELVAETTEDDIIRLAEAAMSECAVVIISDYAKGVLSARTVAQIIAAARAADRPTVVDPKGTDYARYSGATVMTPNRRELAEASGMPTGSDAEVERAARRLIADFDLQAVLCTRGPEGMSLVLKDGPVQIIPARAHEVFDVSGAGDTVIATLAAGLAAGMSLAAAATLANAAAGIVVAKVGTAVAYADELVHALRHEDLAAEERKIVSLAEALDTTARWRRQGFKVGFTNGVFDLLHPGHVSLMRQARAACDRLVVGLNSDASVKRLKGQDRPVQPEAARAAVLASLADVDLVVTFGADTPLQLIEALRPDVLVKGADYTVDQVVGAEQVRSWGGRIFLADIAKGHSTSATIKRIAG
jgi:D-beta-D-heptose 7-phosphate kinase/D-beta-D-heptose 1-phosphate adenosyltransferase